MNFGRVAAPYVGEYIPQWRRVRFPLISGKRGEKRKGDRGHYRDLGELGYARF